MFFDPDGKMLFRNPGYIKAGALEELIYRTMGVSISSVDESTIIASSHTVESDSDPTSLLSVLETESKGENSLDFEFMTMLTSLTILLVVTQSYKRFKSRQ